MPFYGGSNMADLILRAGEARADAVARKGQIWGQTLASLPQSFADMLQRRDVRQQLDQRNALSAAQMRNLEADNARGDRMEAATNADRAADNRRADLTALSAADTAKLEQASKRLDMTGRALAGVTDQPSYDVALSELQQYEVDTSAFPKQFSPGTIKSAVFRVKGLAQELEAMGPKLHNVPAGSSVLDEANPQAGAVFTAPAKVDTPTLPTSAQEYEYAKKQGYAGTYEQYQNMDANRRRSVTTINTAADKSALVQAVIDNPELYDRLTGKQIADIAPALSAAGFKGFGKAMTEATITKLTESKSAIASLRDLRDTLKENEQYIGPIAGLQAMNPYSEARKAQSKIDLVKQRVGKTLEGGVLRKEDEEKYKKILSTLQDEPTTAIYKVDSLITTLERDMEIFIEEQRGAGRRITQPPAPSPTVGPRVGSTVTFQGKRYKVIGITNGQADLEPIP